MIDSIDLIIYDIEWIDFRHLRNLGIEIKNKTERRSKMFWFSYKNIEFKFFPIKKYLLIMTNVKKFLNKEEITLTDKNIYKEKVYQIIKEILDSSNKIKIYLSRIDYDVNIRFENINIKNIYMTLLQKCKTRFKYMKQEQKYKTSMYLKNKYGQYRINFYDKGEESKNIKYKNVLRLEIQVNSPKLKAERKRKEIPNILDVYWSKEKMLEIYFDMLKEYLHKGKYYTRKEITKKIEMSTYKSTYQKKLKKFVLYIERYGIEETIIRGIYSKPTIKKYIEMLTAININPIPIPVESEYIELESLYNIARNIAEDKYFK